MSRYVPNRAGLQAVLASSEVASEVASHASRLASAAGDGFTYSQQMGAIRQRAIVYPDTWSAIHRNRRDNTLVRVLG